MTMQEFLMALYASRNRSWRVTTKGELRCFHDGRYYCPLTEVVFTQLGENLYEHEVTKAGRLLDLGLINTGWIVGAADNCPHHRNIRQMLKRTLELT